MTKRLPAILALLLFCIGTRAAAYNLYIGGLHSHTSFSDGTGIADQAWDTARNQGKTDFWAVTEHYQQFQAGGVLPNGDTNVNKWKYEQEVSRAKTEDGKFVALLGWEWSDGIKAHMNVLFDPATPPPFLMTGTFDRFLSVWLKKHPKSLTGLNHPFWSADKGMSNWDNFKYIPELASQAVYIEVVQPEDIPFYYIALDRGWRVAPAAAQDNHSPNWGLQPEFVAAYANELTADGLREAFIARRFYATTDRSLVLQFTGNGKPMGSQITADYVNFEITVSRPGDPPAFVRLMSNGGSIVKNWVPKSGEFREKFKLPVLSEKVQWYVAYASMPDGRYSISAPIWVKNK
ncbi:MAG: hypothetical protein WCX65_00335 [bacterium]